MILSAVIVCIKSPVEFIIIRGLIGFLTNSINVTAYPLAIEAVGPKYRARMSTATVLWMTLGGAIASPLSFAWNDWRSLQTAVAVFSLVPAFLTLVVAESWRWQISAGQTLKAIANVKRTERHNKTRNTSVEEITAVVSEMSESAKIERETENSIFEIFKITNLRWITFNLMYNWLVNVVSKIERTFLR